MLVVGVGLVVVWLETKKTTGIVDDRVPVNVMVTPAPAPTPALADVFRVVSWRAGSGQLLVGRSGGDKIVNLIVNIPRVEVTIPVRRDGKMAKEVVTKGDQFAFCGGDEVEVVGLGKDWEGLTNGQTVSVERVNNLGPRKCAN